MVNLLSPKQKTYLTRLYVLRLTTVGLFMLAAVGGTVLALLVPSYLVIHAEADQAAEYVQTAQKIALTQGY